MSQDNIEVKQEGFLENYKKNMTIQSRADTAFNWYSANPVLQDREIGYDLDSGQYKIGDGKTPWNGLPFAFNTLSIGDSVIYDIAKNEITEDNRNTIGDFVDGWKKSVAIGESNNIQADFSLAVGIGNSTSSKNNIVLGSNNDIEGETAIAIGKNNAIIESSNAISIGKDNVIDNNNNNIQIGQYGLISQKGERAEEAKNEPEYIKFAITNGKNRDERRNALSVTNNNNVLVTDNIFINMKPADLEALRTGTKSIEDFAMNNLNPFLGVNPIIDKNKDTVDNWAKLGNGYAWYAHETDKLIGLPEQWGFLINTVYIAPDEHSELIQEFKTIKGLTYHRAGNLNGWHDTEGLWTQVIDQAGGVINGAVTVDNNVTITGTEKINNVTIDTARIHAPGHDIEAKIFKQTAAAYDMPNEIGRYVDMHIGQSQVTDYNGRIYITNSVWDAASQTSVKNDYEAPRLIWSYRYLDENSKNEDGTLKPLTKYGAILHSGNFVTTYQNFVLNKKTTGSKFDGIGITYGTAYGLKKYDFTGHFPTNLYDIKIALDIQTILTKDASNLQTYIDAFQDLGLFAYSSQNIVFVTDLFTNIEIPVFVTATTKPSGLKNT